MPAILDIAPVPLGQRLTEARKAAGLTQQQAAEQLGVSRPTLIGIEKGTRKAKPDEIVALAGIYRLSVHDLVRQGADAPPLEPHLRAVLGTDDSPAVAAAIQTLQAFANDYKALEDLVGTEPFRDFPPEAALPRRADLRAFAEDLAIRERFRLHLGDQPIFDLRSLVEQAGVHCFFGDIPSTLAGLYAFVPSLGYCILINRKHPPERRRWTLAHEYAHFLADRHRPGVDYVDDARRKPVSERFADAFAASLLMPETAIRRGFLAVTERTGDFQTADLSRLAHQFHVSAQATALRLEQLGLLPNGTWEALTERGFKPGTARRLLGLEAPPSHEDVYPERYRYLAVQAYVRELVSEGVLARFLRTDRVTAREIVEATLTSRDLDAQGQACAIQIPEQLSLFDSGLFQRVAPAGAAEMAAFVAYARGLDDGEAMALAIAESRGWMLATDDRKAASVAAAAQVAVSNTPKLIKRWADGNAVADRTIGATLLRIKRRARYLPGVRDPLFDWWMARLPEDSGS